MKIQPTTSFILVAMRGLKHQGKLVLPESVNLHPHGEVLAIGPDVKDVSIGDLVLFLAANMVMGFNENTPDQCFLMPASGVIGKYIEENPVLKVNTIEMLTAQ